MIAKSSGRWGLSGIIIAAALVGFGSAAQAQTYSFGCVSNNSVANCTTGAAQLSLTLTQTIGSVDFLFRNVGTAASSIADIYFDWANNSAVFSPGQIINGSGVSFAWGASPPNLPAGNNLIPNFVADLAADSNAPVQPNGVNPGEQLTFRFLSTSTSTAANLNSGALRVGLHVQGFSNGGSESFVTSPIPEPETYAMLLAGLGLMAFVARRRRRNLAA